MFLAAVTVFCLVSGSLADSLSCDNLMLPLEQVDPGKLEGRWTLVADSLRIVRSQVPTGHSDSVSVYFFNSTFLKANRDGESCSYSHRNVTIDGPRYHVAIGPVVSLSGTFYPTSCPDCVMLTFIVDSPLYVSEELCLFSRRREVDEETLREFIALSKCLKFSSHVVMDPNKELCPLPEGFTISNGD